MRRSRLRLACTSLGRALLVCCVSLCLLLVSGAVTAEIYRWTDGAGRLHFSQELDKVPPAQREQARRGAVERKKRDPLQVYGGGSPASRASSQARRASLRSGRNLRIPFERRGTLMKVDVLLNDRVTAPFYIDTGASGVSIPWAVAQQLGIQVTPDTPRVRVKTANGIVAEPVVELRSVQLGGARVTGLTAAVSGSMDIGLLGGAFFNNFVYEVDAGAGVMNLRPNARVRGGLNQEQWRERFEVIREPLVRLDAYLEKGGFTEKGRVRQLEAHREKLRSSLENLERKANKADVPRGWRQ
jgi:clan AA aspartic protease (TIGR02281 family)